MMLPVLSFLLAASLLLPLISGDGLGLGKTVITVYVSFGTYNDEGITAWEVMAWEAQMFEGSPFDYKDFLSATLSFVWIERIDGQSLGPKSGGGQDDAKNGTSGEDSGFEPPSPTDQSLLDARFKGALKLIDSPLVFGLDVPCPDPPGWIPPFPLNVYTCQAFKSALEIEVDKDVIHANANSANKGGSYNNEVEVLETELAVGGYVQDVYVKAVGDGTMEQNLRYIEGGRGAMRILWDDPNLKYAWEKYRPQSSGTGSSYKTGSRGGGGGGGEGNGPNTRAIVGGAIVGGVMFFFMLAVCAYGFKGGREATAEAEKDADEFKNENAASETTATAAPSEERVHRLVIRESADEEDGTFVGGQAEENEGRGATALAEVKLSPARPPAPERQQPPAPDASDSPDSDRAFDLPSIT